MTYNATNDLLTRDEADGTPIELRTAYTYGAGQLTRLEVNPQLADGPDGQIATTYTYTANDQVVTETDPLGRVTRFGYDGHGNGTSEIRNFVSGQPATADRNVTSAHAYDQGTPAGKAGLPTSQTDPVGVTTTYGYDLLGRQTSESLPGDASIPALTRAATYDQLNNELTSTESWTGTTRTTTRVYDRLNRLTSETDPAGGITATAYDTAGDAISITTVDGTTSQSFDGLGQLTEEASANGTATSHVYDAQGGETGTIVSTGSPSTTSRVFDLSGRLLSESVDDGALELTTTHAYDELGQEIQATDPGGLASDQVFDRVGRVVQSVADVSVTDFSFDKLGNQLIADGPHAAGESGPVAKSTYDALNRQVEQIANFVSGSSAPDTNLTWTAALPWWGGRNGDVPCRTRGARRDRVGYGRPWDMCRGDAARRAINVTLVVIEEDVGAEGLEDSRL
jgi:YD repeat-containing protein